LLGLIVSFLTVKHVALPLVEMNRAAKIIANGDFEQRVEVHSNDEVGGLAESFNHMAESLQAHEKVQKDFIANISHDLRSPLTSMNGFLTAMLDGTIPPEKQEKYLKIVLEETDRLSRMTQGIVELSRAQSSAIMLEETDFDINELIRGNIEMLEPQLKEKQVHIRGIYDEEQTMVRGDKDKISRVLQNLLSNAAKFSPECGVIEVETTLQGKKKVLISIKDEGPGISQEDQKYVFDRFFKADTTRNEDKVGSGIGLAIAKEFMLAHGENITVKSEEGKGATFAFCLKLAEKE
ncbi:MAG: HAMP domain-containing histidine kinase, partial [Anaerotignum sp.]|nr:HAMP domain-containing histidine kinase [Anaerotignum sp.]